MLLFTEKQHVVEIQSNRRNTQYPSAIRAVQYVCPSVVNSNLIKLGSVVLGSKKCPSDSKYYVKLNIGPTERNPKLAICTKLTYDDVDPIPIVEWFETQRILGVDKVVNKGNNKIIELRTILQRESQNS